MARTVPASQVADMLDQVVAAGWSEQEIAADLGVAVCTVHRMRRRDLVARRSSAVAEKVADLRSRAGDPVRPVLSKDDVRADVVADMLREVLARGVTIQHVSRSLSLSRDVVERMIDPPRPNLPRDEVLVVKVRALLELARRGRRPAGGTVPATLTSRRLQALAALGWSVPVLHRMTGVSASTLKAVRSGERARVSDHVRLAVARAWGELSGRSASGQSASEVRHAAVVNGWVPPAAWEDERDMADPSKGPDPSAVRR